MAVADSSLPKAIAVGPTRSGLERLADRVLGGDPHQAVLDDAVAHVLLAQGAADLGDLLDREAAVLGDDQRPAAGKRLAQLGDGLPLGLCGHASPPASAHGRCAAVARRDPGGRIDAPATAPVRLALTRRGAPPRWWRPVPASACSPSSPVASAADRSGPADQAPTVTAPVSVAVRGRRLSLAVPSIFSCGAASRPRAAAVTACGWPPGQAAAAAARTAGQVDPDARAHRRWRSSGP